MPDIKLLRSGRGDIVFYLISGGEDISPELFSCDAAVALVSVDDWNRELSPWKAEKCFKNGEDFGGGAGEYLAELARAISAFEAENHIGPAHRALCGYSLAGLCALYGLYECGLFDGAMSASGSMWFDGWMEYMEKNAPACGQARVYLSVGDREARTRNPRLAMVEECTRRACEILLAGGHEAVFELNSGNHFNEPHRRIVRGIETLFEMYTKN